MSNILLIEYDTRICDGTGIAENAAGPFYAVCANEEIYADLFFGDESIRYSKVLAEIPENRAAELGAILTDYAAKNKPEPIVGDNLCGECERPIQFKGLCSKCEEDAKAFAENDAAFDRRHGLGD